jgi:predicted metal-binding protein
VLESESFYMGYHLAVGFATGNCRAIFCAEESSCWASVKGRKCVQPYKGRPSMEAAGMDSVAMARAKKWRLPKREGAPLLAGLVMVV